MQRAGVGFAISVVIGVALGLAVARSKVLRTAFGSMITGLQTMPTGIAIDSLFFGVLERGVRRRWGLGG